MASLNSGIPGTGVYFVKPASRASLATCLMASGVSKSGSPMLKFITSCPLALSSLAICDILSVSDSAILKTRCDNRLLDIVLGFFKIISKII